MAIQSLYDRMGISSSDVSYIGGADVATYRGEKLVLPLNFISSIIVRDNKIAVSSDIIPVFLGFSLSSVIDELIPERFFSIDENLAYFRKFAPIGCRDQYTYDIFNSLKIPAYLNGCLTATFPKREIMKNETKVIFADAPMALKKFIPKRLFDNCEFTTQQAYFSDEDLKESTKIFDFVREHYNYYKQNASLIVTSRLHVAIPCAAMGIPVVFAKDFIDQRFSWAEKLIPLYSAEQYKEINWDPKPAEYEPVKQKIASLAISRVKGVAQSISTNSDYIEYDEKTAKEITDYYFKRNKVLYYDSHSVTHKNISRLELALDALTQPENTIKYALWGANKNLGFWIDFISSKYPTTVLTAIIDSYKTGYWEGFPIHKPDYLREYKPYVIVTAVSATSYATRFLEGIGYKPEEYLVVADEFITEREDQEALS
ncbi:polysaccharide pyruvyl transferase family protein [Desulfitobacterium sp. PCE1]|uniref:polysaccharide pyruvyl transferase family protein n=1 Tax=Desulfitobacterium sp. PCE1 TaxID=146907 RepID=UPI001A9A4520|nr:polysaccharide pyruvyl transferase family protein [Desulfitobacterium sp. PCE1]